MNVNLDLYEAKNKLFELKAMVKGYPEIKTKVKAATKDSKRVFLIFPPIFISLFFVSIFVAAFQGNCEERPNGNASTYITC